MSMFIVFEGIDGSGTTLQAKTIVDKLNAAGVSALHTYEPSSEEIGKFIRNLFTRKETMPSWEAMSLLFSADRIQHVRNVVDPALSDGKVVICERYYYSTIGYQVYAARSEASLLDIAGDEESLNFVENETRGWVRILNLHARKPDITIVLSLSPEIALMRMQGRELDQFECKYALQSYLARYYDNLSKYFLHDNIYVVNSNREKEDVTGDICRILQKEGVL